MIGLAGVLLLAACGSNSVHSAASASHTASAGSGAETIVIKNFMFQPSTLTVAPGAVVTVRNEDTVTHTLTDKSDSRLFNTGDIAAGQSETFRAPNQAGSYAYICMIHQYMAGTLVVR
jgi:plastocyanin